MPDNYLLFSHSVLPNLLHEVQIKNLKVGKASVDLSLQYHARDGGIDVTRREGSVEIVV